MNIALIIAGGKGERMNQELPKQFLHVDNKPIIIYTLEVFEKHPSIDAVLVVCLDGWHEILKAYAKQFDITKLRWVISGGETSQESINNGVNSLEGICNSDDLIIVHDGIRPMIDDDVLSDIIAKCGIHGNAVASLSYNEQIFIKHDDVSTKEYIPRDTIKRIQTPQAYKYGKLKWAYKEAYEKNIGLGSSAYANTLMVDLGETLYFAASSERNIKITTLEDLYLFKALLGVKNDMGLKL